MYNSILGSAAMNTTVPPHCESYICRRVAENLILIQEYIPPTAYGCPLLGFSAVSKHVKMMCEGCAPPDIKHMSQSHTPSHWRWGGMMRRVIGACSICVWLYMGRMGSKKTRYSNLNPIPPPCNDIRKKDKRKMNKKLCDDIHTVDILHIFMSTLHARISVESARFICSYDIYRKNITCTRKIQIINGINESYKTSFTKAYVLSFMLTSTVYRAIL